MHKLDLNDTIAAIATSVGASGIGIIRISGKEALSIADKVFVSKDGRNPLEFKTYTTHYGWIMDGAEIIDEVILTVMRAPKSYTKEDIVEINCHGGIVAMRKALDLVLENGARLAQAGEFTRRAFLNGRIDLAQAEAVLDVISAQTDSALKIGVEQLRGRLSSQIINFRNTLWDILSKLEANIDFPEEEIKAVNPGRISARLNNINNKLKVILDTAEYGAILREGISAVICGKPNVGKSSLLNALLRKERSIVTPIAGTTRDTIEEVIDIKGIPIRIVDTAGIIEPKDLIAKKAVLRSKRYIDLADLVLLVFDGSRRLSQEDEALNRRLKRKTTIAIINKMDLKPLIEQEAITKRFKHTINISAKKAKNIGTLESMIANLIHNGSLYASESIIVSNLRHIQAMRQVKKLIAEAIDSADNRLSLEFIAQDIKEALGYLDDILGKRFSEDLLDKIFSNFCIGK